MSLRPDNLRNSGINRRKKEISIKERNISGDEFMAASIGDVVWLDQSLREIGDSPSGFDRNGLAPIHLAALHGRLNCLQLLVEKYGVDVDTSSATGWRPLHLCINKEIGSKALKCVQYLLSRGADANVFNDDFVSPLHQAASEGLLDCLKVLLADGNYTEKLGRIDKRGHTALDLARIWGHKSCARLLRTEMWKSDKHENAEELKQLKIVKQYYGDLQKEALHQLRNEQEFYGGVAFGNWISDKGLPETSRPLSISRRESYPDAQIEGLFKRLRHSVGGLDDCALRLEKASLKQEQKQKEQKTRRKPLAEKPSRNLASNNVAAKTAFERDVKLAKRDSRFGRPQPKIEKLDPKIKTLEPKAARSVMVGERTGEKTGQHVKKVKVEHPVASRSDEHTPTVYTPFSESTQRTKPTRKTPWNFSTNVNSEPVTDIKFEDTISLSILPDEPEVFLPEKANLPVKLDTAKKATIKMTLPGGHIKSASIRMPDLPQNFVKQELSGEMTERIRVPQEFRAVHVHDLQKKRVTDRPKEEAAMHLSFLGDPRIVRRSFVMKPKNSPAYIAPSDVYDNLPPISENGLNRILGTLNGMNSPRAFLA